MLTVSAAVIIEDGRVLMCRRAPGEKLAGFWEFPGGKQETGESLQQSLERELQEELDVETRAGDVIARSRYCYEHVEIELVGIRTELLAGKISLSVHDDFQWVEAGRLLNCRLAPADVPLAEAVIALVDSSTDVV